MKKKVTDFLLMSVLLDGCARNSRRVRRKPKPHGEAVCRCPRPQSPHMGKIDPVGHVAEKAFKETPSLTAVRPRRTTQLSPATPRSMRHGNKDIAVFEATKFRAFIIHQPFLGYNRD